MGKHHPLTHLSVHDPVPRVPRLVHHRKILGVHNLEPAHGAVALRVLVGVSQDNTWVAALATTGIILAAAYMLYLYRRVVFGKLEKEDLKSILDLNPREIAIFVPLIIVTLWMGIWPAPFLEVMDASIANLIEQHKTALSALQSVNLPGK